MEKAYLQALSVIVGAELRYVAIVTTNARYFDTTSSSSSSTTTNTTGTDTTSTQNQPPEIAIELIKTELGRPYYLCVGKHSFCILDRNMSGNPADGGYLVKIPFRGIKKVNTCGSSKDAVSIDIHPNQAMVPNGCALPESIYIRSGSSERIVQQLRICWKADNMYRTLSVQDLQVEQLSNIVVVVVVVVVGSRGTFRGLPLGIGVCAQTALQQTVNDGLSPHSNGIAVGVVVGGGSCCW